jgi:hypothetical protein
VYFVGRRIRHCGSNRIPFESNRIPSNRIPSNRIPSNRIPSNRTPSNRIPSNRIPSNRTPSNRTPSNRTPFVNETKSKSIYIIMLYCTVSHQKISFPPPHSLISATYGHANKEAISDPLSKIQGDLDTLVRCNRNLGNNVIGMPDDAVPYYIVNDKFNGNRPIFFKNLTYVKERNELVTKLIYNDEKKYKSYYP